MRNVKLRSSAKEIKSALDRVVAAVESGQPISDEDLVVLRGGAEQFIEIASSPVGMFSPESIMPTQETLERNQSKVGDGEPCAICGKRINPETSKWVHMSEWGNIYPASITTEEAEHFPEGTMYLFPVGPECAKKIPKTHLQ